ncbi:MAG: hypothetical protein JSR37_07670 [Verrucomicrobia bacterium]|nr:hypothetical protein [Verrucomicrobiota bacterium]MBS0636446.1 hypothetical protein [Verrucomicrobiota bacterium]
MNIKKIIRCLVAAVAILTLEQLPLSAKNAPKQEHTAEGYRLVHSFWNCVMNQDVVCYSKKLACNFQGLNLDGVYTQQDQISGLLGLTVTSFELQNLLTAKSGNTLVISYDLYATGEGIVSGPSIDVWHKTHDGWKMISHSYVPFD